MKLKCLKCNHKLRRTRRTRLQKIFFAKKYKCTSCYQKYAKFFGGLLPLKR